jgi:hypothetical protein
VRQWLTIATDVFSTIQTQRDKLVLRTKGFEFFFLVHGDAKFIFFLVEASALFVGILDLSLMMNRVDCVSISTAHLSEHIHHSNLLKTAEAKHTVEYKRLYQWRLVKRNGIAYN